MAIKHLVLWLVAVALGGCAYPGGGADNPIIRKFTWFSFIEGGDLAAGCGPGAPARYRIVYNGVYDEQVRVYELGDGATANRLVQRALAAPDLSVAVDPFDPLGPWRGRAAERLLRPEEYRRLLDSMAAAGAFGPPNVGLELPSRGFYWTVAACHQGRYAFNGWLWPNADFQRLDFDRQLLALDLTGVPVNQPRPVPPRYHDFDLYPDFTLRVGARGLWGVPP